MDAEKKQKAKVLKMAHADTTPMDLAISVHLQNMFATYGEDNVRRSLGELFGMKSKTLKQKVAS